MIYEIAGLRILINNKCKYTDRFCKDYLCDDQDSPYDFEVSVTKEEFDKEKSLSEGKFSDGYIENICLYRNICLKMPKYNRFILHSAILEYEGKGYAFLGHSGAGKSTHTGLWIKYLEGSRYINGDKPIIEYKDNKFIAYGTPWMGKEGLGCKDKVVLNALCFIEKAKVNKITRLSIKEMTDRIFSQVLLPKDQEAVISTLSLVDKLVYLPGYVLECDISKDAVLTSYNEMKKN